MQCACSAFLQRPMFNRNITNTAHCFFNDLLPEIHSFHCRTLFETINTWRVQTQWMGALSFRTISPLLIGFPSPTFVSPSSIKYHWIRQKTFNWISFTYFYFLFNYLKIDYVHKTENLLLLSIWEPKNWFNIKVMSIRLYIYQPQYDISTIKNSSCSTMIT